VLQCMVTALSCHVNYHASCMRNDQHTQRIALIYGDKLPAPDHINILDRVYSTSFCHSGHHHLFIYYEYHKHGKQAKR